MSKCSRRFAAPCAAAHLRLSCRPRTSNVCSPHWTRPWIAAAATVAAVAITLAWQLGPRPAATPVLFETVTSPVIEQPINYVLEVQFVPDTATDEHSAFFESIGASKLAVPLNDRSYRVALGLGTVTLAELQQYAERVESRPEIASARFVAVQLPVE